MIFRTIGMGLGLLVIGVSSAHAAESEPASAVGGFVDLEWRVFGLGGHVSHGPGFAAGITLLDGHLRLGVAGFGRPGPWNPATFDVTLPEGETYRGKRVLSLRSDGAMSGVHVAFALPLTERVTLTLPATIGYGGFGFYLQGDDRQTPDGRRVSEWENELFGGKDSYLGLVVDAGMRLHWRLDAAPWLKPYVAGYYTTVPNFETVVRDDYSGISGALGLEVSYDL
jgi:hypothetical protein